MELPVLGSYSYFVEAHLSQTYDAEVAKDLRQSIHLSLRYCEQSDVEILKLRQ